MNMIACVETISPEIAASYLETSAGNRSLKRAKINSLKRDMMDGNFVPNGESIIFDDMGHLIDGHHRLTACKETLKTIQSVVVRGVPSIHKKTVDTGASRTAGDHLSIAGMKNGNLVAGIVSVMMSLTLGRPRSANPSTTEIFDFIEKYPSVIDAASFAATKAYPRMGTLLGSIYFIAGMNGEASKAEAFKEVFSTGVPSYKGCPAHLLRERMTSEAMKGKKTTVQEMQRLTIAAWEKFRAGVPVKVLKAPSEFKATGWPKARGE